MALEYLPHPHDPPIGQTERLAATLQPVVFFVVLGSILIHGLSIPFLTFGKKVRTMSISTWSRQPTREGGQPEWTTLTRHVLSGDEVVINKDHTRITPSNLERGQALSRVTTGARSGAGTPSATTLMHSGISTPNEAGPTGMTEKRASSIAFRNLTPLEPALIASRIRELVPTPEERTDDVRGADRLDDTPPDTLTTTPSKSSSGADQALPEKNMKQ